MRRRTFDQLVELKLLKLSVDDTVNNLIKTTYELLSISKKLGKTYLGAKLEDIAGNMARTIKEVTDTNQDLVFCFDRITDLALRM